MKRAVARHIRRLGLLTGLVAALVVLSSSPAWAHAVLVQTAPVGGQILRKRPTEIRLQFNEPVEASLGAVRLYDTSGRRLDTGATTKPSAQVVAVAIRAKLTTGAYVVTWRVISADSHPVQGSFTFQVGTNANATSPRVQALASNLLGKQGGSTVVGATFGVARWLVFTSLALLVGSLAFVLFMWPQRAQSRRTRRLVWCGWATLAVASPARRLGRFPVAGLMAGFACGCKLTAVPEVLVAVAGLATIAILLSREPAGDVERLPLEVEFPDLDLRVVEDVVDDVEQSVSARPHDLGELALLRRQVSA